MAVITFDDAPVQAQAPATGGIITFDDAPPSATPNDRVSSAFSALPAQPQPSALEDAAKSIGAGLGTATIGVLGAPGDARTLLSRGVDYVGNKLGVDLSPVKTVAGYLDPIVANAPTSEQVKATVTNPVVSPDYQPQTLTGDYLKTGASFAPGMLMEAPGGLAGRFIRNVALPAIASETAGQVTKGTEAEPYARAAGALLSPAIEGTARRLITPLPATAARQAVAATLRNEGVPLTAGQATGSKPLQWMESTLADTPGSGGVAAHAMENQGEQFTGAALRRAGIDANRATPDVIDNAFTRIGNDFETVGQRNNVTADRQLGHDLLTTQGEYNNLVSPSNRAPVVANTIHDISDMMAQNNGVLTGEQYNAISSRLARQARNARQDPQLQEALQGLRTSLDDAMERSMQRSGNNADMQLLQNARNQYRNLLVIEKAATGAGSNAAEGLISPSALRNAVVQQSRRAYGRGQGDFADLARAGEAVLKPLANSGTSPRHNVSHILQTIGAVAGGALGAHGGGAEGTTLGALAGLAAPGVAGRALLSRPVQAYLGNQVLPRVAQQNIPARSLANLMLASPVARRALTQQGQ